MPVTIMMFIVSAIILAIPILVGYYVYRDAKKRNMDAALWTLVAVLVPGLIGLIIYFVVRGNTVMVVCPVCEKDVIDSYVLCPHCGNHLKACCKTCNTAIEPSWSLCPKCGTTITSDDFSQVQVPKPRKDKSIRILLIVVIALPLLALIAGVLGMIFFIIDPGTTELSSTTSYHMTADPDFVSGEVIEWMTDCDRKGNGVYILRFSPEKINEMTEYDIEYDESVFLIYIYINQYDSPMRLTGDISVGFNKMEIHYTTSSAEEDLLPNGYELTQFHASKSIENIEISIDGQRVDAHISDLK